MRTLRVMGTVPTEVWNRIGEKSFQSSGEGSEVKIGIDFSVSAAEAWRFRERGRPRGAVSCAGFVVGQFMGQFACWGLSN
jgi:hypothetical protein